MKNRRLYGSLLVIVSAILFGTMPLFTKTAYAHHANALTVAFGRFLFGSLFLGILCKGSKKELKIPLKALLELFKISMFFSIVPVLLYMSYSYVDSGLATTLHFSYPVAVAILSKLLYKSKFSNNQILCIALCSLGILFLYKPGGEINLFGMFIALLSGIIYAGYILLFEKRKYNQIPALVVTFWLSLMASLEIGMVAFCTKQMVIHLDISALLMIVCLSIITMVFATPFFQMGVKDCGGLMASLLSTFEPVTSLIVGILFFQEVFTFRDGIGILFILISTILLVIRKSS